MNKAKRACWLALCSRQSLRVMPSTIQTRVVLAAIVRNHCDGWVDMQLHGAILFALSAIAPMK
jgi:hypothetical protein